MKNETTPPNNAAEIKMTPEEIQAKKQVQQDDRGAPSHNNIFSEISTFNRDLGNGNEDNDNPPLWLITFTDIMALMLTFFVLLYSMSVPQEDKWDDIIQSLGNGFSKFTSPPQSAGVQDSIPIEQLNLSDALNLDYLRGILQQRIESDEALKNVILITQNKSVIISLPQELLFESGETQVNTAGKRSLFALGGMLERIHNRIEIIGHSDPRPNPNSSNWELSLARAIEVSNILRQVGYKREMITRGTSSARYDELPADLDEETRLNLSRRVDIVVMKDDGGLRNELSFR